ncbi:PIG-X-domain-containing protein [Pleomassaria siparia CBS 279.74]|uniref:Protein PBN1 n=1 Tax=Pleomassaria siparia CBS 279.74 TaxID=1314801 RepID=A0A6G1KRM7_9PLEO|nr:PIG-X-domain-containing protein [Pleomassaria siparia CBS 279.74]
MKQRITYLVQNPDAFSPEQLQVKTKTLKLDKVVAAKEHRVTFGLSELPKELSKAFEQWHELHIRWASESAYKAVPPFTSRVSPGLHAFFTPIKDRDEGPLCPLLTELFGDALKCQDSNKSFIKLPILSERFSHSASTQYYSHAPSLSHLVSYIQTKLCKSHSPWCKDAAASLLTASYLDMDYDTISHAVILSAYWEEAPNGESWTESISLSGSEERIEVGVLIHEPNPDPEDIGFGGFLTVLGEDDKPSMLPSPLHQLQLTPLQEPTRFQTPTRHYPLPSTSSLTYSTRFSMPTGLHPTLLITLPTSQLTPPAPTCRLHAHLTLPSSLILDKYQFSDPLFLTSSNIDVLRSIAGATDLEAPDWVIPQWGSAALFSLVFPADPSATSLPADWEVSIPLHVRYLPAANSSHGSIPVPWPVVFWACRAEEGAKMAANPFDRLHLGYEALFGPKTRFMHVSPSNASEKGVGKGELVEWIDVPILDLGSWSARWVEVGTVGTVLVAFLGLCWVLFTGLKAGKQSEKEKAKKKQ